jgi:hypothetical protein
VSIRRLFWLGAAVLFSVAALVAIAAVLGGSFDETQWKILATCAIVFVAGSTALAGLACIDRGVFRVPGGAAIALGTTSFAVWTGGVWSGMSDETLWKLAGILGTWTLTALVVTTLRLLAGGGRLMAATMAAAVLAALTGSAMILAANGDAWQLLVVLIILTLLGYLLTPVLRRLSSEAAPPPRAERLLGTIGSVDVVAVRGDGRTLRIGDDVVRLDGGESVVLRTRA